MFTAAQLVAHLVGDYFFQSDWQANQKLNSHVPALVHALLYTVAFVFLTRSIPALAFIAATHFLIDRYRLAKYLSWAKNFIAPRSGWPKPWAVCKDTGGYDPLKPPHIRDWLVIITDNTMHLLCNGIALAWLV